VTVVFVPLLDGVRCGEPGERGLDGFLVQAAGLAPRGAVRQRPHRHGVPGPDSSTDHPGAVTDTGVGTDPGAVTDRGAVTDPGAATAPGAAPDTGAASDRGAVTDTGAASDPGAVTDPGVGTDPGAA